MSALKRGRKPQNHENDIRQAPGTELWLPSRYKVTHQGCPEPHNIRRQRFKINGTPCVTAVARLLGWLGKSWLSLHHTVVFKCAKKRHPRGSPKRQGQVQCIQYWQQMSQGSLAGPPGALCRALQGGPPTSHFYGSPHVFEVCSLCLGRIWTWIDFRQTVNKFSIRNLKFCMSCFLENWRNRYLIISVND